MRGERVATSGWVLSAGRESVVFIFVRRQTQVQYSEKRFKHAALLQPAVYSFVCSSTNTSRLKPRDVHPSVWVHHIVVIYLLYKYAAGKVQVYLSSYLRLLLTYWPRRLIEIIASLSERGTILLFKRYLNDNLSIIYW